MVIEKEINKLVPLLTTGEPVNVNIDGFNVSLILQNQSIINLSTLVWSSNNYIPSSVRKCIQGTPPFPPQHIKTGLHTNEELYNVSLNFSGGISLSRNNDLRLLIEEFVWQAEQWRLYLDEHDKNDLVHVHVR